LLRRIAALPDYHLEGIKATLDAIEHNRGSVSPAEEFIGRVLLAYSYGRLKPQWAADDVEELQREFESMLDETRFFVQRNPEHFRDLWSEPDNLPLTIIAQAASTFASKGQLQPAVRPRNPSGGP
jgi:hypothetical protein